MIVQLVRWKSALNDAEVRALFEARASRYRRVEGLVQKYYVRYRSGEHGAVYLWESEEARQAFLDSELGRGMAAVFRIEGEKETRLADVVLTLREDLVG